MILVFPHQTFFLIMLYKKFDVDSWKGNKHRVYVIVCDVKTFYIDYKHLDVKNKGFYFFFINLDWCMSNWHNNERKLRFFIFKSNVKITSIMIITNVISDDLYRLRL